MKIEDVLRQYGDNAIKEAITVLRKNGKDASGRLIASLSYTIQQVVEGSWAIIFDYENYGDIVDKGRKPGTYPPIAPINNWLSIRGIPQESAFPIVKSIYKFGIKPTPWLYALQPTSDVIKKIEEATAENIQNEIVNTLKVYGN